MQTFGRCKDCPLRKRCANEPQVEVCISNLQSAYKSLRTLHERSEELVKDGE